MIDRIIDRSMDEDRSSSFGTRRGPPEFAFLLFSNGAWVSYLRHFASHLLYSIAIGREITYKLDRRQREVPHNQPGLLTFPLSYISRALQTRQEDSVATPVPALWALPRLSFSPSFPGARPERVSFFLS